MKILYLHQYFTTPGHSGGIRSYQFAKRLVEQGCQVDIITSTAFFPVTKEAGERFISQRTVDGINVHAIHIPYSNKMSFGKRIRSFLLFMLIASLYTLRFRKSDLIYATSTPLTIGIPALTAKLCFKIPMVFEVRDVWPDIPIAMGIIKNRVIIAALKWFELKLYHSSAKIVALSSGMRDSIISKGTSPNKVFVIPNACDIDDFAEQDIVSLHPKFSDANDDTKICIYAGTFGIVNNLNYLIDLASEMKAKGMNIKIALIGSGIEKEEIATSIQKRHLEDTIRIMNPVPKKELISYIKGADCCISTVLAVPELYNNSANKFFDALAAGRPIAINHEGWQQDIIEKNNLGVVLNQDIPESAARLSEFIRHNNKDVLEKRILRFAEENYSRDQLFEELWKKVVAPLDKKYSHESS